MMNDRERAQVVLLRRLLQIERGETQLLGDAMRQLLVATGAELVLLDDPAGRFAHHCSISGRELDVVRARVVPALVEQAIETGNIAFDPVRANVCIPILGATIYLQTRGVFVDADIELLRLFAHSVEAIAHDLANADALGLHEQVRAFQVRRIQHALDRHGGNVAGAARSLKIQRSLVYRLLRRG
jgi:transcriptional regulator with GAF, ATPase, and Fis domain